MDNCVKKFDVEIKIKNEYNKAVRKNTRQRKSYLFVYPFTAITSVSKI